ncbi:hypothetical protein VC83_07238 [Pseudogymnoascus destructans]|uniref:DUF1917 domain-containing protein n=2 Tax=Pseudogymnoascus destructans TaxID=655981 RepID=L8G9M0_PSED2|nr:uncharacterized protein VC83_07238 [Pseudogymnoascus destructans]ELR09925.1 hypothetical protein GMDG_04401 [Pseudogymnoascus destructans 20631-21]OAF56570.1 hypothetical protein VC83_07238 [Pseudogymnoascus destructans]
MPAYYYAQISPAAAPPHLFNGKRFARQHWETVDQFLQRLPPATTEGSRELQWIWISNPYVPPRQFNLGGIPSDEWSENVSKIPTLRMHGEYMLNELEMTKFVLGQNLTQQSAAMISIERDKTVVAIQNLAIAMKIITGKWMLFPPVDRVNHIWSIVAHAVATGQLGLGAKVSPKLDHPETGSRLICIYTDDFSNIEDVIRVLRKLRELGLVPRNERPPIYYKCDAYTYLEIFSGNRWDIRPSLYSSKEML